MVCASERDEARKEMKEGRAQTHGPRHRAVHLGRAVHCVRVYKTVSRRSAS